MANMTEVVADLTEAVGRLEARGQQYKYFGFVDADVAVVATGTEGHFGGL